MDASRMTWPTALADACDAKKEGTSLDKLWYRDEQLTLTVTSIQSHRMGDQITLKGADIDVVVQITKGSDVVDISFYPRG